MLADEYIRGIQSPRIVALQTQTTPVSRGRRARREGKVERSIAVSCTSRRRNCSQRTAASPERSSAQLRNAREPLNILRLASIESTTATIDKRFKTPGHRANRAAVAEMQPVVCLRHVEQGLSKETSTCPVRDFVRETPLILVNSCAPSRWRSPSRPSSQ